MMRTSVERLIEKIEKELGITGLGPDQFHRLYPGINQRTGGAWTWAIDAGLTTIGSAWPVKAFLKKNVKIGVIEDDRWKSSVEIVPEEIE